MKKILFITYYWPPGGGPGVQRGIKLTKYLPSFGIEPLVMSVRPDKASYPVVDETLLEQINPALAIVRTDSCEPMLAYTRIIPGATLPKPGFADESSPSFSKKITRFIRGNFFIPDARRGWNKYLVRECRKIIKTQEIAAIFCTSPPHSTQLAAMQLSRETGIPWIADLRDPWTDIYYNRHLLRTHIANSIDRRYERKVLLTADRIITVSVSLRKVLLEKSAKLDPQKVVVIPNGFDHEDFTELQQTQEDVFRIAYTGTMTDDYPIDGFIRSVELFLKTNPGCRYQVDLAGHFSGKSLRKLNESAISAHVNILGVLHQKDTIALMKRSSVLLLIIPDAPKNEGIVTGKLFEYIGAGNPVLGFGPTHGDAAAIIEPNGWGRMFDYKDPIQAAGYLEEVYKNRERNTDKLTITDARMQYSRRAQAGEVARLIINLTEQNV